MKKIIKKAYQTAKKPVDAVTGKALKKEFKQYSEMLETVLSGLSATLDQHQIEIEKGKALQNKVSTLESEIQKSKNQRQLILVCILLSVLSLILSLLLIIKVL